MRTTFRFGGVDSDFRDSSAKRQQASGARARGAFFFFVCACMYCVSCITCITHNTVTWRLWLKIVRVRDAAAAAGDSPYGRLWGGCT